MATHALPLPRGHNIDRIAVVLPAHNEDEHLDRALRAVQRAADASLSCWVTVIGKASRVVAFR